MDDNMARLWRTLGERDELKREIADAWRVAENAGHQRVTGTEEIGVALGEFAHALKQTEAERDAANKRADELAEDARSNFAAAAKYKKRAEEAELELDEWRHAHALDTCPDEARVKELEQDNATLEQDAKKCDAHASFLNGVVDELRAKNKELEARLAELCPAGALVTFAAGGALPDAQVLKQNGLKAYAVVAVQAKQEPAPAPNVSPLPSVV